MTFLSSKCSYQTPNRIKMHKKIPITTTRHWKPNIFPFQSFGSKQNCHTIITNCWYARGARGRNPFFTPWHLKNTGRFLIIINITQENYTATKLPVIVLEIVMALKELRRTVVCVQHGLERLLLLQISSMFPKLNQNQWIHQESQ